MYSVSTLKSIFKALINRGVKLETYNVKFNFYNFWVLNRNKVQDVWLANFIDHHFSPLDKEVNIFSVFGNREIYRFVKSPKIFFTGENIHTKIVNHNFDVFDHQYMDKFDLSIGFDYEADVIGCKNYIRFPLWLMYIIPYDATKEVVREIIDNLNNSKTRLNTDRLVFASNISRHDNNGIRGQIIDLMSTLGFVECAGDFRNNTDVLRIKYQDDKLQYLRTVKFNICPENSDAKGYTTEKVFESIQSGCIPIYWGSGNTPEVDILNQNAIISFNPDNIQATRDKIQKLINDENHYHEFLLQKPFKEEAVDVIWDKLQDLKIRLASIIIK